MNRVHIVGCSPRSGTTLMLELLHACFVVDSPVSHERDLSDVPHQVGSLQISKKPHDILIAAQALDVIPNLYVVCMLRDPRDIISSRHGLCPDRYWVGLNIWKCYYPKIKMLEGRERFIIVDYEALASRPDDVQNILMQRMPFLQMRYRFSLFERIARPSEDALKALGALRPISTASIGNWRKHLPRIKGQLLRHGSIDTELLSHGYEYDAQWSSVLANIEPDMSESCWPEDLHIDDLRTLQMAFVRNSYIPRRQ